MLPISGSLWGWSRIMHIKNLGIIRHMRIPHKCKKLSSLNSESFCCYVVTLHFHYLRNWPTIKRNKITCQSAGKQIGDEEEPRNTISYLFSESYFSLVQWRDGNRASVKSILMWKFSVGERVQLACPEIHIPSEKVLSCTLEGGGSRALVKLPLQKTLVQSFPAPRTLQCETKGQGHP